MTSARPVIALMLDHFLGDYQTVIRDAIETTAKERDADFFCFIGRPIDSPFKYEQIQNEIFNRISNRSVSGVIVAGGPLSIYSGKKRIQELCLGLSPLPVCSIGLSLSEVPSVVVDNTGIALSVAHLIKDHHCRRFAFIGGPRVNEDAAFRRAAFLQCLERQGVPFDPNLEETGEFTIQSGCEAMSRLLAKGRPLDAVVAANDTTALGAITTLKKNGIRVPRDVKVTGFDDILSARFHNPTLTTVRQPIEEMGRYAVDSLLKQMRGERVLSEVTIAPTLVRRQSCGCFRGQHELFQERVSLSKPGTSVANRLKENREIFERLLLTRIQVPADAFSGWAKRLLDALEAEANGNRGRFVNVLGDILDTAESRIGMIDELQNTISLLRVQFLDLVGKEAAELESMWHDARILLSDAVTFDQMRDQVATDLTSALFLRRSAADLPATLTKKALVEAVTVELATIGLENGLVSVFSEEHKDTLECIVAICDGSPQSLTDSTYPADIVIPPFLKKPDRASFVVVPLSNQEELLGVMVLEHGVADVYYEILREHMSSYLKSVAMFQNQMAQFQAQADEQRRALEMQHRQKLESLGVLAGGIAHDFNNMLSAMAGNLDVALMDLEKNYANREPLMECKTVVSHASGLCRQLLAYSGKGRFQVKRTNLNTLFKNLEDLLKVSISKGVTLRYGLRDGLPDIEGDIAQLTQVFVNLVINASEAIGQNGGTILVTTGARFCDASDLEDTIDGTSLPPDEYVIISVSDTGEGIEETKLSRIFDPFYTTKFTGRGLGLAAVLGIVRGHRGAIRVSSKPGFGTRFEILFPRLPMLRQSSSNPPEAASWVGEGTVLIVDDEPTVIRAGVRLLKRMGFSVLTATNGEEGVREFQAQMNTISCVILDITMPVKGGVEAMVEMRAVNRDVPIVLTSGYSEEQAVDTDTDQAPDAFLQKPYDYQNLSRILQRVLAGAAKTDS